MKRLILAIALAAASHLVVPAFARPAHAAQQQKSLLPKLPQLCDPLKLLPGCANLSSGSASSTEGTLGDLWQRLLAASAADLKYAKALADAAATPGSKLRSTCYGALITANEQASGINLKNADGTAMTMPDPHVISTAEQVAEVIDDLQPTAPVMSDCAAAAEAAKQDVTQFLTTLLAAVAVKTATGGLVP